LERNVLISHTEIKQKFIQQIKICKLISYRKYLFHFKAGQRNLLLISLKVVVAVIVW